MIQFAHNPDPIAMPRPRRKCHEFEVFAGQVELQDGRPHWPDCLELVLDRDTAASLIGQLSVMLREPSIRVLTVAYPGEMRDPLTQEGSADVD